MPGVRFRGGTDGRQSAIRAIDSMCACTRPGYKPAVCFRRRHPVYSTAVDGRGGKLALSRSVLPRPPPIQLSASTPRTSPWSPPIPTFRLQRRNHPRLSADGGSASLSGGSSPRRDETPRRGARKPSHRGLQLSAFFHLGKRRWYGPFKSGAPSPRFLPAASRRCWFLGGGSLGGRSSFRRFIEGQQVLALSYLYDRSYPAASLSAFNKSFAEAVRRIPSCRTVSDT
jgi:hypothetical protein